MEKEKQMADLPMTIYSCKFKNSWQCEFKGNLPTGARRGFGKSVYCNVLSSNIKPDVSACDQIVVEETPIVAKVTKSGMIT
ncbi:MAG: hypothetical protein QY322_00450 [bacterium]|nr:MAG: hypothetical protein QY322_00450 [bacterium]